MIRTDLHDARMEPWLLELEAWLIAPEPMLRAIGEELLISHRDRIDRMVSPDGTPFAPLSPKYQAQKKYNRDRILVAEGHLRDTLFYTVEGHSLLLGSNRVYARAMHYGLPEQNVKARPWLGLSREDEEAIGQLLQDHAPQP